MTNAIAQYLALLRQVQIPTKILNSQTTPHYPWTSRERVTFDAGTFIVSRYMSITSYSLVNIYLRSKKNRHFHLQYCTLKWKKSKYETFVWIYQTVRPNFPKGYKLDTKGIFYCTQSTQIRYTPQTMLIRSGSLLGIWETFIRFHCKWFRLWRGSWCQCIAFS